MKLFAFSSTLSGYYDVRFNVHLKENQTVMFGKYEYKKTITRKPKWWQFWMKTEIVEECIPVDTQESDIKYFFANRI